MEKYKLLKDQLKMLDLSAINDIFAEKAEEYRKSGLDYVEYLGDLINHQIKKRIERSINYRLRTARFPWIKTYSEYDFDYQDSLNKEQYLSLMKMEFIKTKENVILLGPPGVGKTHLAISLGVVACENRIRTLFISASDLIEELKLAKVTKSLADYIEKMNRYPLLIIDELGYMPLTEEDANLFFQLISRKYENSSIIITTNQRFKDWGKVFQDDVIAAAILDRLLHHSYIFTIIGKSFRLKGKSRELKSQKLIKEVGQN
jgi:DNA replication protein DnaC